MVFWGSEQKKHPVGFDPWSVAEARPLEPTTKSCQIWKYSLFSQGERDAQLLGRPVLQLAAALPPLCLLRHLAAEAPSLLRFRGSTQDRVQVLQAHLQAELGNLSINSYLVTSGME